MTLTMEAAQARINVVEKLRRAIIELDACTVELRDLRETFKAQQIKDASSLASTVSLMLIEQVRE